MRTERFRRWLISISLVFALVLSIAFTLTPVRAAAVISYPGHPSQPQNIFDVIPGQTFLLRHRLAWDDPANLGYYLIAIYWDHFGDNARHFTLESAVAYFDNDGDNLPDPGVALIDNTVDEMDNGTRHAITVSNVGGANDNDGIFNVDITLRAAGPDGTPHAFTDNHPIYYVEVTSVETVPFSSVFPAPVTVRVLEWTAGVVVEGKDNAYNTNGAGMPPYVDYNAGDRPPIMVAQRVDSGAFVAGGIASTTRNYRWNDISPLNPDPHLDNLLDAAFQWMVPGATDVLWMEDDVYNDTSQASQLITALTALGYTIVGDDRPLENMYTGWIDSYAGSISENLLSTDDSYAMSDEPENNGDDLSDVHVGRFTYEENDWGYMKWDLSALSAATSITSATLILDTYYDPDNDMTVGFYESDDAWNEDSLSWDNRPTTPITGDTNFNDAYTFATEWDNYGVNNFDYIGWHSGGLGLFISEYIEGTSYNKAIEIYTSSPVDLSGYQLERYTNGATTISSFEVLSGTLDSGDVYVIAHASADAAILAVADLTDAVINHNGDDGYVLRRIGDNTVIDSIGQYGVDPGAEWDPVGGGGKDQTQVRRTSQIATLDMTQIAFGAWWNVDVTDYVQAQFASDNVVSIMLKSENENLPASEAHSVQFASHERSSGVYGPFLEITYEGTVFQEYDYGLENFDILVINQLQRDYDDRYVGGDPDKVRATEISIIDSFVRGGGGLLITEGGDYGSHNYARIGNKILDALDSDWWFQHDQVSDNVDNWYSSYSPIGYVDPTTAIGSAYKGATGTENIGLYSVCSLAPSPTFGVDVSISPSYQGGLSGKILTYTITVVNTGNVSDNYLLSVSQSENWISAVSPTRLTIPPGENRTAMLSVGVPSGAICTLDNITVTALSETDNAISDNAGCFAHRGKAELELKTLYKVSLDLNFYVGSPKLVAKFYTFAGAYQAENVIWSGLPPEQVILLENIPHPENKPVERVKLILTDNVDNEISTIASLTVTRDTLYGRIVEIYMGWPFASFAERDVLNGEVVDIYLQWPFTSPKLEVSSLVVEATSPHMANGVDESYVSVTALDICGALVPGANITVVNYAGVDDKEAFETTDYANGTYTAFVTSTIAGETCVTAIDSATDIRGRTSATFDPGPITDLELLTVTSPRESEPKDTAELVFVATDNFGNVVPLSEDDIHVETDLGYISSISIDNYGDVAAAVTSTDLGNATISITVAGIPLGCEIDFPPLYLGLPISGFYGVENFFEVPVNIFVPDPQRALGYYDLIVFFDNSIISFENVSDPDPNDEFDAPSVENIDNGIRIYQTNKYMENTPTGSVDIATLTFEVSGVGSTSWDADLYDNTVYSLLDTENIPIFSTIEEWENYEHWAWKKYATTTTDKPWKDICLKIWVAPNAFPNQQAQDKKLAADVSRLRAIFAEAVKCCAPKFYFKYKVNQLTAADWNKIDHKPKDGELEEFSTYAKGEPILTDEEKELQKFAKPGCINVYYVENLSGGSAGESFSTGKGKVVVDSNETTPNVLAHEIGHHFGLGHDTHPVGNLMHDTDNPKNTNLTKAQCQTIAANDP